MSTAGPFFHRAGDGDRFCYYHPPYSDATGGDPRPGRGCILAVHAFAEEMNKTRAAVAEGARALADAGYAVLQIDLAGCGDSAGDFEDATWSRWLADLGDAWQWLAQVAPGPRWLWGTRFGALLADDFAGVCSPPVDGLLLWQPVVNGAQHLGQFLRLKTVNSLLKNAGTNAPAEGAVSPVAQASPRADLASGLPVEVAGYRLNPALADAIEQARLGAHEGDEPGDARVPSTVRWFEVSSQASGAAAPTISPVAVRVADRWRHHGSDVTVRTVVGNAFWQTLEVERCDALVAATVEALTA
jgi:exosortase A-associated hydrolase 2